MIAGQIASYRLPLSAAMLGLLLDCWTYFWHWLNHASPFLWRFHRLHHSDREMNVTTANRFHLGEITFGRVGVRGFAWPRPSCGNRE
ncbi:MAG: sterol desaturase family protein [Verrucomicrobia bacterium]|nr:sterol desaturase family protein [Verrucomicrobiota bacterium]